MRKLSLFLGLIILLLPFKAASQEAGFGAGVILGEPTGISLKNWLTLSTAIDFGIAWSFTHHGSFHLHADFLVHNFDLTKVKSGRLAVYFGIGGRFKSQKRERVGVRFPLGLCYIPEKASLDIFLEIGPLLDLAPSTEFGITGGFGIRYYF